MGHFAPVVSTSLTPMVSVLPPNVSVNTPTISYNQLLNSLGTYNYGASFFYMHSESFKQINQPFYYVHFDSNGNQIATYLTFAIDPYQQLPAIYYDTDPSEVVFDGFSNLAFTLYKHEQVYFKMYALISYASGDLNKFGRNNFQKLEDAESIDFFEGMCDYIIDNPQ